MIFKSTFNLKKIILPQKNATLFYNVKVDKNKQFLILMWTIEDYG